MNCSLFSELYNLSERQCQVNFALGGGGSVCVENNPVRAGMVKRAWEYPWSNAKFHPAEQKVDVLVKDGNLLGLVANGREFLQGEGSGGEKDLRRATKTGRPLFDHEHLARIEKKTGRNLQKAKPGRKPPDSMK